VLQAFLVDAETSEVHPSLSDGQRTHDIDITVENVAAGLLDVASGHSAPVSLAVLRTAYYASRHMADARLLVLVSLSDGPKHGYAIQADVNSFAAVHLGPGTLHGALNSLERDGLVEALPSDQRRRPYRLTQVGRHQLRDQLEELDRIRHRATSAVT